MHAEYVFHTKCQAGNGSIQVNKNEDASVRNNTASGDIECVDNGSLASSGNAAGGDLDCSP